MPTGEKANPEECCGVNIKDTYLDYKGPVTTLYYNHLEHNDIFRMISVWPVNDRGTLWMVAQYDDDGFELTVQFWRMSAAEVIEKLEDRWPHAVVQNNHLDLAVHEHFNGGTVYVGAPEDEEDIF